MAAERVSQVVIQVLESYSDPTSLRASQNVLMVLESYSNPTSLRVSQTVLMVLRSLADAVPGGNKGYIY